MRFSTFSQVVEEVRLESKISTNPSRGIDNREYIEQIVKRNYEFLWDSYEWEHLNIKHTEAKIALQAGQNIYSFPSNIDLTSVSKVYASVGVQWIPVEYGITLADYSQINPTLGMRADPVQKWEARSMDSFEVYPMPASNVESIGFDAKEKYTVPVQGTDIIRMDALCIILLSSAEIMAGNNAKEAQLKLKMAQDRIDKFKARTASKTRFRIGLPQANSGNPPKQIRVAYAR